MKKYKLVGFRPSDRPDKKYYALLRNLDTGRETRIHFGHSDYQQYTDRTGLGFYSHLDHGDAKRRRAYHKRHKHYIKPGFYSPGYFSLKYLW